MFLQVFWQQYLIIFTIVVSISYFLNSVSINFAIKNNILDNPNLNPERKHQKISIPLLGFGGSFFVFLFFLLIIGFIKEFNFDLSIFYSRISDGMFEKINLFWLILGTILIYIFGYFDDKFRLKSYIYAPIMLITIFITVVFSGLRIEVLSEPFNSFNFGNIFGLSEILAFLWLTLCLSCTKFLDGHDGLVSSISVISFLSIGAISTLNYIDQPLTFLFCLILIGVNLGFLPYNLPNAKAYLGEGGSTVLGLWIGILSLISGAKIATSFSVIGWFILDILFVFLYRFYTSGFKLKAMVNGDSKLHWHHRLAFLGLNKWQVLIVSILMGGVSAYLGIVLPTSQKIYLFIFQLGFIILSFSLLHYKLKNPSKIEGK
jgi:UDP-N-acetylmuramyl pentapeptide phosphotransferase/UDP-N-acetylglucosamine-1-phosphate transferase